MRSLILLLLIAFQGIAFAQNSVVVNTTDYHNIVMSNEGNLLNLHTDYDINYDFIFTKKEIRIIKNFTGDIFTDIYDVKNYKVNDGVIEFKTNRGNINLDITNNLITIKISNNNYICYYFDKNNDNIEVALNERMSSLQK
nr:MAG: hypothetical protein B6I27_01630 [Erwiniaceae bacterium 4572_131]